MFEDKTLQCRDCGADFMFTVGEQEFYAEKGFENLPARCPECRAAKRASRRTNGGGYGAPRQMYTVVCASCGVETEVPFEPTGSRPVYCRDCFQANRQSYGR
ncbi:MAG: zinc-binding protein [Desulforudis sp.]|nr:zinc-ribbon domain containing protein [Clostridia bacterium]MDQ7791319.1 zinc-ribbon domain containing protein [Clostridia bacterium]RJX19256.1 MAG: zinc-binding protein [Desulforudis sp.]